MIHEVCRSLRPEDKRPVAVLNTLLQIARPTWKKLLQAACTTRSYPEGMSPARAILAERREAFPEAMTCRERDREACLTALKFLFLHRRPIRATNLLERLFGAGKRRTKTIPRVTFEASGLLARGKDEVLHRKTSKTYGGRSGLRRGGSRSGSADRIRRLFVEVMLIHFDMKIRT